MVLLHSPQVTNCLSFSLPVLALTVKATTEMRQSNAPPSSSRPSHKFTDASASSAARYRPLQPHLFKMSPAHLLQLGAFLLLRGPQPLPVDAVGELQPFAMTPQLALSIADDILAALSGTATGEASSTERSPRPSPPQAAAAGSAAAVAPLPASLQRAQTALQHKRLQLKSLAAVLQDFDVSPGQQDVLEALLLDGCGEDAIQQRRQCLADLFDLGAFVDLLLTAADRHAACTAAGQPAASKPSASAPTSDVVGKGVPSPELAGSEVRDLVLSVFQGALDGVQSALQAPAHAAEGALEASSWQSHFRGLQQAVGCLSTTPGGSEATPEDSSRHPASVHDETVHRLERVNACRDALWNSLQRFLSATDSAAFGHPAVAALLELQAELSAGSNGQWAGWTAPTAAAPMLHQDAVLFGKTMATLGPHFQGSCSLALPDVAEPSAAQTAFLEKLLPAAGSIAAVRSLQRLLVGAWQDGGVWGLAAEAVSGQLALSPLHSCWEALLHRMLELRCGEGALGCAAERCYSIVTRCQNDCTDLNCIFPASIRIVVVSAEPVKSMQWPVHTSISAILPVSTAKLCE